MFTLGTLVLTRSLQYLLDLADSSLLLFIKVLHSDGITQFWRWGLQKTKQKKKSTEIIREINCIQDVEHNGDRVSPYQRDVIISVAGDQLDLPFPFSTTTG